jgi:radical SAM protein with 4Fe4S-binding SPASM domain
MGKKQRMHSFIELSSIRHKEKLMKKAKRIAQVDHERTELWKQIPLKTPYVIYIEPSGFCNLKCEFCPQSVDPDNLKRDIMSFSMWQKAIAQIKEFESPIKMLRVCGNGEPLMNPKIVEMLHYSTGIAEKIELVTNGTMLNHHIVNNIGQYCTRIIISVEGLSSDDYEKITTRKINFDDFVKNISDLYANKHECVIAIKTIDKVANTFEKKNFFYKTFEDICDETYIENLIPMWPELPLPYDIKSRWDNSNINFKKTCVQIFKSLQIYANGDVTPCCVDWKRKNKIGNIGWMSLKDIWESCILKGFQEHHLGSAKRDFTPCYDCVMNETCDPDDIDEYCGDILEKIQ